MKDKNIPHFVLRKLIGKLASLTPSVVYYPKGWPTRINDIMRVISASKGGDQSPLTTAAISMACAMHEHMQSGDTVELRLAGVTRGTAHVGDFIVSLKRI